MPIKFKQDTKKGKGDLIGSPRPKRTKEQKKQDANLRASTNPQGKPDNSHIQDQFRSQSHGLAMQMESSSNMKERGRGDATSSTMAQGSTSRGRDAKGEAKLEKNNREARKDSTTTNKSITKLEKGSRMIKVGKKKC